MKRLTKKYFLYYFLIFCFFFSFLLLVSELSSILKNETHHYAESIKGQNSIDVNNLVKYNGNFLQKYPNLLDCKNKLWKKWSSNSFYENKQQIDYSKIASRANLNSRMLRGILVYFPMSDSEKFIPELKWYFKEKKLFKIIFLALF